VSRGSVGASFNLLNVGFVMTNVYLISALFHLSLLEPKVMYLPLIFCSYY
jgi:hypothetical protein